MARCTAPVRGHSSSSAAAKCPACRGGRYYGRGYSNYSYSSSSYPSSGSGGSSNTQRRSRPSWSPANSTLSYKYSEIQSLTPIRRSIETRLSKPDRRDVFLCHAWDDRANSAKKLHDLLESEGVSVWFSEKDVLLGASLLREIDKGLAKSRVGIVLVTPAFLERIEGQGIAEKELSALLARDLLIPIVHNTTYEELRDVSPLLGSRSGLSTNEDEMQDIASKIAELVSVEV